MLYPSKTYKKNTKLGLAGFYETKLEVLLSSFLNNKKKKTDTLAVPVSQF